DRQQRTGPGRSRNAAFREADCRGTITAAAPNRRGAAPERKPVRREVFRGPRMRRWTVALLVGLAAAPRGAAGEPPLPPGALARLGDTRYRHADGRAAGLSPDGRLLALPTFGDVTVYDLA